MKYSPIQRFEHRPWKMYNGYILRYVPEHPKAFGGGFYYEHRLWAERFMGRVLKQWESVHHISGKTENNWENLFICTRSEHDYAG